MPVPPTNPPYPPNAAQYVVNAPPPTAPPQGFIPDGQQPPPYTQQYQPNAPPQ
ncbi:hypothetical protein SK128_003142 [Halocaridina rubra]|uniref:Uncharacterized protein n=1 Tax=Halocaridina rubra TaxID=373956 RepID=A0AAN8X4U2_HALRR